MGRRRRSGCCIGQIIKLFLLLLLIGGTGYWIYSKFLDRHEEFVDYYKEPIDEKEMYVHESHYDYSEVSKSITSGCDNDYQKIRAIYKWICDNIEYDTSYSIHTADSCYDAKKGVCQAYCELFYQIAKACGVSSEIVSGKSKDKDGEIGSEGHAWIFAYTRKNYGILMDPTWGAGSVANGSFSRSENCWDWFSVQPEWMILSHFPENDSYQLISNPLTMEEFISLAPVNSLWIEYGMDAHMLFEKIRKRELEMPCFYGRGEGRFEIVDIPLRHSLKVGEYYTFRIKMKSDDDFTIINNNVYTKSEDWTNEGDKVYSIKFMVRDINSVSLCIKPKSDNIWNNLIDYKVESPTILDWKNVEEHYPLCSPDVKDVKNLQADAWENAGIDGHLLLSLIRENGIRELPILYSGKGQKLKIVSVPMQKQLWVGESYTFRFIPESGRKWAIINGDKWYNEWDETDEGVYSQTIIPMLSGELKLSVQLEEDGSYWSCLGYQVN